jgi:hypothetical protein
MLEFLTVSILLHPPFLRTVIRIILYSIWQRTKRRIIKYGILIFCVFLLITIMHIFIPEQGRGFRGVMATILKNIEGISICVAVILYFMESGNRKQRRHYDAWQVVDAAHGIKTSRARIRALRDLYEDNVSFNELDLPHADLSRIILAGANLSDANLSDANLSGTNLSDAKLSGTNLRGANLRGADLSIADLSNADLSNAKLSDANLSGTNLSDADLRGAENLTPEQVKKARNWEKAKYSEEFRAQLGFAARTC